MKPSSQSIIANLPADQRARIEAWLFQRDPNLTYAEVLERCKSQLGLDLSRSTLGAYRQALDKKAMGDQAFDRLLAKVSQSAASASAQLETVEHFRAQFSEALMGRISQLAFEKSLKGETFSMEMLGDFAEIAALGLKAKTDAAKVNQKEREIELAERRVKLLEDREAKSKTVLADESLTAEQKEAAVKQILGVS